MIRLNVNSRTRVNAVNVFIKEGAYTLKSKKYYDITNLLNTKAQYMILLGQRANGKSYQAKLTVLTEAYEHDRWFVYLRRYKADIKAKAVEAYFEDMDINAITKGEYEGIIAWNGVLYFSLHNEKDELVKGKEIGRYCALNEYERYKSWAFVDYDYIIYEEFITDNTYLVDEPRLLQQFVSTVARHRSITVLLVGNTLSRVCPYFAEWCLEGVLKQKLGTIEIYHHHFEDSVIDIAVEYCANANYDNKMFFGQTAKQIIAGEWDTTDVPKLPRKQSEYENVYELLIEYQKFQFVLNLLVEPMDGGIITFVYPFTGTRKILRKITEQFSDNPFISARLDLSKRPEFLINECFRTGKVCYSDNLTGSDFKHVNEVFKIGRLL